MIKIRDIKKTNFFMELFTQISGVVIILFYNELRYIPILTSLLLAILFMTYFRQLYLIAFKKPEKLKWISTAIELALIICMGFIDQTGFYILFFFICVSEAVIYYEFKYSAIVLTIPFLASRYTLDTLSHRFDSISGLLIDVFLVSGVSIVFVVGMSLFVRMQLREKEKLARINGELELAYKNLLEASAAAEQLTLEKERLRMAREIHDTLAHTLTNLTVQLEVCKKLSRVETERLEAELEKARELTREGLNDVKRTIKSLRPQALEGKPFFESILDFINSTMNNTEIHIILDNHLPRDMKLLSPLEITIFRLIQESITNSVRHGQAGEIGITLDCKDNAILLDIRDNGAGCPKIKKGFGLGGIQERIEAAGGTVQFASSVGKGFETKVTLPLKGENP